MSNNDVHQNQKQSFPNYPPPIQSQPMYGVINQSPSIYNNVFTNIPQSGNHFNNQTNMEAKTVPPTPPPDSSIRCMTPSNIKPGKNIKNIYMLPKN